VTKKHLKHFHAAVVFHVLHATITEAFVQMFHLTNDHLLLSSRQDCTHAEKLIYSVHIRRDAESDNPD